MDYKIAKDKAGNRYLEINVTDYALINNPLLNKGMAFTEQERRNFNLIGLIPPHEATLENQRERSYLSFQSKNSDIEKYLYLRDLQDSNETLFYSLLTHHIEEFLPIVYTPTVGIGCQRFSHMYRRPRGVYISYPYQHMIDEILAKERFDHVKVIVVSDGERILGLGDQGAGGMGIPIGKLTLYSGCAGIHPASTLPIFLDTGTNNPALLNDPLYIGWRHERIRGQDYDDFVNAFVVAVKKRFPHVLLQWEDFAQANANPILQRYRDELCTFNDDIQGTAAVAAGALFAAIRVTGIPLIKQRIVVLGAGSAGCGISKLIMQAMIEQGLSIEEAQTHFYLVDRAGLITTDTPGLQSFQLPFAQTKQQVSHWKLDNLNFISLMDVIKHSHPTLLIGVSGQPQVFTQEIVREMAKHVERPIIFPLSNPTDRSEALPQDLIDWTDGKAIISTGSPFGDIIKNGKHVRIDQTNNCYIFPGMGLGLVAVGARRVTDEMFMAAALALADESPANKHADNNLLPPLHQIREISFKVACAVANKALEQGLADFQVDNVAQRIKEIIWHPVYLPYHLTNHSTSNETKQE